MSNVFKRLSNVTIVDRTVLVKLKGDDLAAAMVEASNDPTKPVRVIDNPVTFFSDAALFTAMEFNSPELKLIAEFRGIKFADEDLFVLSKVVDLKDRVKADLLAQIPLAPPPPPYPFAKVPDGWTYEDNIVVKGNMISRKYSDYRISLKQLERLWNRGALYWLKQSNDDLLNVQAGGHHREASFFRKGERGEERIVIGCQEIHRYEIEQVALKLGWTFPPAA
jgi:hypothetical protein